MTQAALFFDDLIAGATVTASSEASASLEVENLQSFQPSEKWRGTDVIETLNVDFGQEEFLPYSELLRHNLTAAATIRVRISNNSDMSSPSFDATFYAWPSIAGYDEAPYDGNKRIGYDNAPIVSNFDETFYNSYLRHSDTANAITVTANDDTYAGRYLRYDILDAGSTDGFIEAGVWRAGALLQPEYDIDPPSRGVIDDSQVFLSYGRTTWVNERNKRRTASFRFGFLSEVEANFEFDNLMIIAGASRPVTYLPFTENTSRAIVGSVYGLIDPASLRVSQVRRDYTHYSYEVAMSITQIL